MTLKNTMKMQRLLLQTSRLRKLSKTAICRFNAVATFTVVSALSLLLLTTAVSAAPVRLANFSGFTDADLSGYVEKTLRPDIKAEMEKRDLALFVLTRVYDGQHACYSFAGLTKWPGDGLNARIPDYIANSFKTEDGKNWDGSGCGAWVTRDAIEHFNKDSLQTLLNGIEATNSNGPRKKEKANADRFQLQSTGVPGPLKKDVLAILDSRGVYRAFDYRHVETYVRADGVKFDDGIIMCIADAGITARPPIGRYPRWPAVTDGFVRLQTGGDIDGCKGVVVEQAVNALYSRKWTAGDLLKDFARTKEEGIPLPDAKRVAELHKVGTTVQRSTTQSRNVVSCTNKCVNGSCVRTFPDGRQERWQAPRKFDPLTNNWGWDTTTNACGL